MRQCDICGKEVDSRWDLTELLETHRTKEVQEVCDDCRDRLNKKKRNLQSMASKIIQAGLDSFIKAEKRRFNQEQEQSVSLIEKLKEKGVINR